jgi:hypothetical protein
MDRDIDGLEGLSSSITHVAWDFAGQLEYSTLHPVSKQS